MRVKCRTLRLQGLILKVRNFSEQDAFITVFTKERGKITCVAKGLRNIKSHRANHIELLSLLDIECWKNEHAFYLTHAKTQNRFKHLKQRWESLLSASFMIETLDRLCAEEDPHERLFYLTIDTLKLMDESEDHELLQDLFLLKSLGELGYLTNFRTCSECRERLPLESAYFDEGHLTLHCAPCEEKRSTIKNPHAQHVLSLDHLKLLYFIQQKQLQQLLKVKLEPSHRGLLQQMGRRFLRHAATQPFKVESLLSSTEKTPATASNTGNSRAKSS